MPLVCPDILKTYKKPPPQERPCSGGQVRKIQVVQATPMVMRRLAKVRFSPVEMASRTPGWQQAS